MSCADLSPPSVVCAPTTAPTRPAAVDRDDRESGEHADEVHEEARPNRRRVAKRRCFCASAPIAAICHTFPGTYLPEVRDEPDARGAGERERFGPHAERRSPRLDEDADTWRSRAPRRQAPEPNRVSVPRALERRPATGVRAARAAKPMTTAATSHCAMSCEPTFPASQRRSDRYQRSGARPIRARIPRARPCVQPARARRRDPG